MILYAVVAGLACLAIVAVEARRSPGDPYTTMRLPVAGGWAATWLCYGLNLAAFPAPDPWTLVVLTVACAGTLLMCPARRPVGSIVSVTVDWLARLLLTVALLTVAVDLYFITDRVTAHGVTSGLIQYRLDRITKAGEYSVPGMEVLHAAVTASGALGFGQWLVTRRPSSLLRAMCGFMVALCSTGRWDVAAYLVWMLAIHAFIVRREGLRVLGVQTAIYVLIGVFFVAHGQLLGKVDGATALANQTSAERAQTAESAVPTMVSGGLSSQATETPDRSTTGSRTCVKWLEGAESANAAFREMPRVSRVFVLYFSGPLATLDRALCEGRQAERVVLTYWPRKLARLAGLRPPELLLAVDPFLDIGIPFNNYTAIYHFLSEVGPVSGLIAWLLFGAFVGVGSRLLLRTGTAGGVVAGTAPLAMMIRAPWNNTFFDGTLVIWIAIALLPLVASRLIATAPAPEVAAG